AMPPKWALGYQQSHRELRDANLTPEQLILNVVDTFRQKQIPVDSVVYLGTGFTPTGWNKPQPSFEFNPAVFSSDPKDVLKKLHDKHVKVVVHMRDLSAREQPHLAGNSPRGTPSPCPQQPAGAGRDGRPESHPAVLAAALAVDRCGRGRVLAGRGR